VSVVRLTKERRRAQLLDVAAEMVAERGVGALTMEGLAARAGVSKALPYAHFDNADAVLVALYRREVRRIGEAVGGAVAGARDPYEQLRSAIGAYFDAVRARGPVLAALTAPGSRIPAEADGGRRLGVAFVAGLLVEGGMARRPARLVASILLGALSGAVDAWVHGDASRSTAEQAVVDVAWALIQEQAGRRAGRAAAR
jgi:AcrR family transcriptional regulator